MGRNGRLGEDFAAQKLADEGYEIIGRNVVINHGEIDIIATKADFIAFVEVKTRRRGSLVSPAEAVTPAKRRKLIETAILYCQQTQSELQPRFDVFEVITAAPENSSEFRVTKYEHIEGAYDSNGNV